jgi:hypothetical protein
MKTVITVITVIVTNATGLSFGGRSPYTSTGKTNMIKYT